MFSLEDHAYIPYHRPALIRDSITLDQPPTVHCDSEATTADTCSIPLTLSSFGRPRRLSRIMYLNEPRARHANCLLLIERTLDFPKFFCYRSMNPLMRERFR